MARRKQTEVTVRALISFDGFVKGDTEQTPLTPRVAALVAVGMLEVIERGESETGPAGSDADDSGGSASGTEAEGAAGAEPGEDPGAGGHGPAEG